MRKKGVEILRVVRKIPMDKKTFEKRLQVSKSRYGVGSNQGKKKSRCKVKMSLVGLRNIKEVNVVGAE